MNQNKKHTPLTAEELVKLLDIHSSKETDVTDLDDFERDALEGFSTHTSVEIAKELMNDVQSEISKKISDTDITSSNQESDSEKHKIIWFSAAASLLLIVSLSILFIKKTTINSNQSIALKDINVKEEHTPTPPNITTIISSGSSAETKPLEIKEKVDNLNFKKKFNSDDKALTSSSKVAEQSQKNSERFDGKSRQASNSPNNMIITGNGIVSESVVTKQDKAGDFETLETADNSKKMLADEVASVPVSSENEESENLSSTLEKSVKYKDALKQEASKQKPAAISVSSAENKSPVNNIDGDKIEADTKAYTSITQNTSSTKPILTTPAYYTGSEIAIKDYILTYHKKINSTQKLQGTFLIKAKISHNGAFKLTSINSVSKDYSDCKNFLKEALNSMKDWNPASENGAKIDSDTQFMLIF